MLDDETTPRPWVTKLLIYTGKYALLRETRHGAKRVDDKGEFSEADAALIVRAVNSFDAMRNAIERYLRLDGDCDYTEGFPAVCPGIERAGLQCHWCELHDALVKAGKL